ncbi:hypothetical protein ASF76_11455 [Microbacterium sp. Leaf151]|nr:hypothetical protein ASF76_11455 [Microbacterium sp. Leaf151]
MSLLLKSDRRVHAACLSEVECRDLRLAFLQLSGPFCFFVWCEVEGGSPKLVRVIGTWGVRK